MHKEWLKHKVTREQAEAENTFEDSRLGPAGIPFGFQNAQWRKIVMMMQDGDELWTFSSDGKSWQMLCGRAGISLVRGGEIVDSIVTDTCADFLPCLTSPSSSPGARPGLSNHAS
ncbi:MAG TPA: hypothetical protein VMF08_22765 [Candidatus Sulfotelmatobacter sp.]|nr:hypothetical protein [Candidatus Sulfotelmatobacter sp.]